MVKEIITTGAKQVIKTLITEITGGASDIVSDIVISSSKMIVNMIKKTTLDKATINIPIPITEYGYALWSIFTDKYVEWNACPYVKYMKYYIDETVSYYGPYSGNGYDSPIEETYCFNLK